MTIFGRPNNPQSVKNAILFISFLAASSLSFGQSLMNGKESKCEIQVAFAISEGGAFHEYSITDLIELSPGESFDFREAEFRKRQIYPKVNHDEMFIVRFGPSGITHFLDASVANGYESYLNGGCSLSHKPLFSKDGDFFISPVGSRD